MLKRIFTSTIVVGLLLVLVVYSSTVTHAGINRVSDSFNKIQIKQPDDTNNTPYWWIIQNGDQGQYYAVCGDASCVTSQQEKNTSFARLRLFPDATPGNYTGSEISELRTGYSYGQPARWLPTINHPVIATARVRFSPNYHQDGTGGAVGSAGFWLWNSPIDISNNTVYPANAFGFTWMEIGSASGLSGLTATVMQDSVPVYVQPITTPLNMVDWMMWTMEWSVNNKGIQSILYKLNDVLVGQTTLTTPLPALSITFWNDNQYPTIENGQFVVQYHNPTADQNFDIDSVTVSQ